MFRMAIIVRQQNNIESDKDVYTVSYEGAPDVKFSKNDVKHWDREGFLKGYKNDLAIVKLRSPLANAPVEVADKPSISRQEIRYMYLAIQRRA